MEDPESRQARWIYLAMVIFGLVFAVALAAHFTVPPERRWRAANDPVCVELRRKQVAAGRSTGQIDQQHSNDRFKQIDDELQAEACP